MTMDAERPARAGQQRLNRWAGACVLGLLCALGGSPALANSRCINEEAFDPGREAAAAAGGAAGTSPRQAVAGLVRDALLRSNAVGAARLLVDAAEQDISEAAAAKRPQAALTGAVEPQVYGNTDGSGSQLGVRAGVTLSQTVYDGGRNDRLIDWRRHQAEATRLGMLSAQEQIALTTLSLALERSRYRMQVLIYGQYVRKMGCLVEALDTIVKADSGRTSELVQARKQVQQAELQQSQAVSQARLVEAKLRRVVGDGLPGSEGMASLMMAVPELPQLLTAAEQANDIAALAANAQGLRQLARAMEAGTRPQVAWNVSGSAALGNGSTGGSHHSGALSAGVSLSLPLLNPATDHTVQAARKRSEAAALQREEALEAKRQRIVELHEQATAAFDRVRRVGLVLRDSERLRNFTLQQWQQLGRRSLFDVMGAEADHYNLRVQYVNALHDGQQFNAMLTSLGPGLNAWLQ
jgi:adhesin transport system outer membrane protein